MQNTLTIPGADSNTKQLAANSMIKYGKDCTETLTEFYKFVYNMNFSKLYSIEASKYLCHYYLNNSQLHIFLASNGIWFDRRFLHPL